MLLQWLHLLINSTNRNTEGMKRQPMKNQQKPLALNHEVAPYLRNTDVFRHFHKGKICSAERFPKRIRNVQSFTQLLSDFLMFPSCPTLRVTRLLLYDLDGNDTSARTRVRVYSCATCCATLRIHPDINLLIC